MIDVLIWSLYVVLVFVFLEVLRNDYKAAEFFKERTFVMEEMKKAAIRSFIKHFLIFSLSYWIVVLIIKKAFPCL